eukprot:752365-Hanusia_phi.AAC.5
MAQKAGILNHERHDGTVSVERGPPGPGGQHGQYFSGEGVWPQWPRRLTRAGVQVPNQLKALDSPGVFKTSSDDGPSPGRAGVNRAIEYASQGVGRFNYRSTERDDMAGTRVGGVVSGKSNQGGVRPLKWGC